MEYRIEVYDAAGRRAESIRETPVLEIWRRGIDEPDVVRGLLPTDTRALGNQFEVRAYVEERLVATGRIVDTSPEWSDAQKLILDDYVKFHEVLAFEAVGETIAGNKWVSRVYGDQDITSIVRDLISAAPGPLHYTVDHDAYPSGAEREHSKFIARKNGANELEVGGISAGQWVGSNRIDATGAYAKDGDTIAGLVVDGEAWPDVRMMMIDTEESSLNSHAVSRHPEVADWDAARYNRSGYKLRADGATNLLQSLVDTEGIDYIELNTHRNALGEFDDRVDAYGRYIGLVYGGGQCFNAALVEQGWSDVYLFDEGRFHDPEWRLKDYFSYGAEAAESVMDASRSLDAFDFTGGAVEALVALGYTAGGYGLRVGQGDAVRFWKDSEPDHVIFFEPLTMGFRQSTTSGELGNLLTVRGNPVAGDLVDSFVDGESIDAYGVQSRRLDYFAFSGEQELAWLAEGLLDDVAYAERSWEMTFYNGRSDLEVGDLIEVRGAPLRDYEPNLSGEWGGEFAGKRIARVQGIRHRISGRYIETTVYCTSPLRSVVSPLSFIVRSQEPASALFEFRLDQATVGLDLGYRLD